MATLVIGNTSTLAKFDIPQKGGVLEQTRREFVKGGLASLGFLALPGGLFAAPAGWKPKGRRPNLVFGVLSDTHMRVGYGGVEFYGHNGSIFDDQAIVIALKYFKRQGVDAILHCGDVTDCGMVREMEFYKEAWDKVYGNGPRPVNMIVTGNHDNDGGWQWARAIAKSDDPAVYKKFRLGPHNLKKEMERIWGEPYDEVWHKTVKGYHFFGFGWPTGPGEKSNAKYPYKGILYHDSQWEGTDFVLYQHRALHMVELVRRERESGRLDTRKPFFTADHALNVPLIGLMYNGLQRGLDIPKGMCCNGIHFGGHGHLSNAHYGFSRKTDNKCYPVIECSTLAYYKGHVGEGETPLFARGFGDGRVVNDKEEDMRNANHALLVRVYDDTLAIDRIWVGVKPKHAIGSLGETWVMPLDWGTEKGKRGMGRHHPFHAENYAKVIGAPEFPPKAKLDAGKTNSGGLRIKIPKADGNPKTRVYGYQIVVAGDDRKAALKKNCYARGYNMGIGYEPDGGVTTVEIPASELPAGKRLIVAVRPCSSLGTKGKPITTTFRT